MPVGHTPLPAGHEPFDIPGVRLTHKRGHCTFHTLLAEYKLNDPLLRRMANMIDEADVAQDVRVEPVAAGLDFLCLGLRRISANDHEAIEHGWTLYEALYAQLAAEAGKE